MPSKKRPFKEDRDVFVEQVNSGMTRKEIADFWQCSEDVVTARKKEFDCFDYQRYKNVCNQYTQVIPNDKIFETIDNEFSAYWLGFLYADGSVGSQDNRIELSLAAKDLEHIEKFKDFIKIDNAISYREKVNAYRYSFKNKKIKQDLIKLGCVPKKSLVLKFPNQKQVPDNLIHHFMRGYFDGDGYIANTDKTLSLGFIGTESFLLSAINKFNLKRNKIHNVHREDGAKRYLLGAKEEMIDFLTLLYKDSNIHLERKYEKYLSLLPSY